MGYYKIAGIPVKIEFPEELLNEKLAAFLTEETTEASLIIKMQNSIDEKISEGEQLYKNDYLTVVLTSYGYRFRYNTSSQKETENVICIDIDESAKSAFVCISEAEKTVIKEPLFYALRDVFFMHVQRLEMIPIHSASIIYKEKAFLFSGPAGTGKSTQTNLWRKMLNVDILDGDVTLLSVTKEGVIAHGLPWCGTSNLFMNKSVPLGAVIFLEKGMENEIVKCSSLEAIMKLCARSFAPNYNKELTARTLATAKRIGGETTCINYRCLPDETAVICAKEYVDKCIL